MRAKIGMLDDEDPAQQAIREAQEQAQAQVQQIEQQAQAEIAKRDSEITILRARLAKQDGQLELGFAKIDSEERMHGADLAAGERDSTRRVFTAAQSAASKSKPNMTRPGGPNG